MLCTAIAFAVLTPSVARTRIGTAGPRGPSLHCLYLSTSAERDVNLSEFQTNLVLCPRMHFMRCGCTLITPAEEAHHESLSVLCIEMLCTHSPSSREASTQKELFSLIEIAQRLMFCGCCQLQAVRLAARVTHPASVDSREGSALHRLEQVVLMTAFFAVYLALEVFLWPLVVRDPPSGKYHFALRHIQDECDWPWSLIDFKRSPLNMIL